PSSFILFCFVSFVCFVAKILVAAAKLAKLKRAAAVSKLKLLGHKVANSAAYDDGCRGGH
ncbi:MAG: hypothetical protein ACRD9R_05905, partial [Pyrinomonadaceae bacterium]